MNPRLPRLETEREISAALFRYARALDERRWHMLDDVFDAAAVARYGPDEPLRGRDAIVSGIRQYLDPCGPTQHMITNIEVRSSRDVASSRCCVRAAHASADGSATFWAIGSYEADWRRTAAGWRAASWTMVVSFNHGDISLVGMKKAG